MRRYTILLIAAIALFTTSCKTGSGSMYRRPIDIGTAIAYDANFCIKQTNEPIMIALLCDAYYSTEDVDVRESINNVLDNIKGCKIDRNDTKSNIIVTYKGSDVIFYTYNISEKLLSEGGAWSLGESYTMTFTPKNEGIDIVINIPEYYSNPGEAHFMVSNISYDIENGLNYRLDGTMKLLYGNAETYLSMAINEPLAFSTKQDKHPSTYSFVIEGFYDGSMDVVFCNATSNIQDDVHMDYIDAQCIKVTYLDYTDTIDN